MSKLVSSFDILLIAFVLVFHLPMWATLPLGFITLKMLDEEKA
jgi:hypothetical protein